MAQNANLRKAHAAKNDEFYTQLSDIEKELKHYKKQFKNKTVLLNCDDPKWSAFYTFFSANFEHYGLKKLIATHYNANGRSYMQTITRDINGDGKIDGQDTITKSLKGNGDFRSDEAQALLQECDIVVSNPPFSLALDYMDMLVKSGKKFLFVGHLTKVINALSFNYIHAGKVWLGVGSVSNFRTPTGEIQKFGNIGWYTNMKHSKRNEIIVLTKKYKKSEYTKFEHIDAINIDKVVDIPLDYKGLMGVPISYLSKHNPDQFEIVDLANASKLAISGLRKPKHAKNITEIKVDGVVKSKFTRILIRAK